MAEQTVSSRTVDGVEYPAVGTYVIDVSHTRLGFAVRHMAVSKVRGEFRDFSGTLELAENPADSKINVTIQAGNSGLILATPSDPRTTGLAFRARQ